MPKQPYPILQFQGGLNNHDASSDISDAESTHIGAFNVSNLGKMSILPGLDEYTINPHEPAANQYSNFTDSVSQENGNIFFQSGFFHFSSPYNNLISRVNFGYNAGHQLEDGSFHDPEASNEDIDYYLHITGYHNTSNLGLYYDPHATYLKVLGWRATNGEYPNLIGNEKFSPFGNHTGLFEIGRAGSSTFGLLKNPIQYRNVFYNPFILHIPGEIRIIDKLMNDYNAPVRISYQNIDVPVLKPTNTTNIGNEVEGWEIAHVYDLVGPTATFKASSSEYYLDSTFGSALENASSSDSKGYNDWTYYKPNASELVSDNAAQGLKMFLINSPTNPSSVVMSPMIWKVWKNTNIDGTWDSGSDQASTTTRIRLFGSAFFTNGAETPMVELTNPAGTGIGGTGGEADYKLLGRDFAISLEMQMGYDHFSDDDTLGGTELILGGGSPNQNIPPMNLWTKKLQGFRIYWDRIPDDSKDKYLLGELNFTKGWRFSGDSEYKDLVKDTDLRVIQSRADVSTSTASSWIPITIADPPRGETFETLNGYRHDEVVEARYGSAVYANGSLWVGDVIQNGNRYNDRILKSPRGNFDVFPENMFIEVGISDGDKIMHLDTFENNIVVFKQTHTYLVDITSVDQGQIPRVVKEFNSGILHWTQVTKIDDGIVWISTDGIYAINQPDTVQGYQITNLLQREGRYRLSLKQGNAAADDIINWQSFYSEYSMLGYSARDKKLIIQKSAKNGTNNTDIIVLCFKTGALTFMEKGLGRCGNLVSATWDNQQNGSGFPNTTMQYTGFDGGKCSNFISDNNQHLSYVQEAQVTEAATAIWNPTGTQYRFFTRKWQDNPKAFVIKNQQDDNIILTKDFDFKLPRIKKTVYKVIVTFKSTDRAASPSYAHSNIIATYGTNGSNTYTSTFDDSKSTNYSAANGLNGSGTDWITAVLKPTSPIRDIYSFRLAFKPKLSSGSDANTTIPAGFEINEMTIIYRAKGVDKGI